MISLNKLWGRITGADKDLKYPDQQSVFLGRVTDHIIIYPYGSFCDLPDEVLLKEIDTGSAIPVTVKRPDDTATGEPVFFHPVTNSRIIFRNNGDIDIYTTGNINRFVDGDINNHVKGNINNFVEGSINNVVGGDINSIIDGNYNIEATNMTIDLTGLLNIEVNAVTITTVIATASGFTHNGTTAGNQHIHSQGNDSNGDAEVDTGKPHS